MSIPQNIGLEIRNITFRNRRLKFRSAMGELANALGLSGMYKALPVKEHDQEPYFYKIQQELSDRWVFYYQFILRTIYDGVVLAFGLPSVQVETMQKAIDDGLLRYRKWGWFGKVLSLFGYKGKVVYSPETGRPIRKNEFDALIAAIEKFLNRKTAGAGEKIILDAVAIGKIIRRMGKYQSTKDMESLTLDTLKYRGKTFDWITDSTKNVRTALGEELSRREQAIYQAAQDWAAAKVTHLNNVIKDEIKDTILYGIREHRGKARIAQDLFNKMGGLNRDWKRIADTEMVNTSNLAGILEEVSHTPEGEKVYFKRYELPGCCDKCAKIDGMIVLWSDTPLDDDRIKDKYAKVAIWEGKPQDKKMNSVVTGTLHPNCRGGWARWGGEEVDAMAAKITGKAEQWDEAVNRARAEYTEKGIAYPNDQTEGYTERINEIYRSLTTGEGGK